MKIADFMAMIMTEEDYANSIPKVFDWNKAARIIREEGYEYVLAGLEEDWWSTAGRIVVDGEPFTEDYTYLMSFWATPVIVTPTDDDEDEENIIPCWCYKTECEWDAYTQWPDSALQILNS